MTAARRTKRQYNRQPKPLPQPTAEVVAETLSTSPAEAVVRTAPEPPPSVSRPDMRAERPDMRAPMRTSAEEAAIRAAQIFENVDLDSEEDKFSLPANLAPEGWEYEWKAHEIIGKRNPGNEVQLARMGWEPVDTTRHPEMMPSNYSGAIEREGMILMQRPKIVNDRQRQAAYNKAVGQVRGQEQHVGIAPSDTMQRTDSSGRPVGQTMGRPKTEFVSPGALKNEGFVPVSHRGGPIPIPE